MPESLARAVGRVVVLAPGGFVAGYLLGRVLGNVVTGCPPFGPCDQLLPILIAIPAATIGMGAGCALAAARVGKWWEGVAVWAVGILAMLFLVVSVGWLGRGSAAGRALALGWLAAGALIGIVGRRRPDSR